MTEVDISKEVRYLNKDFISFRNALTTFAKIYYPDTFKDFSESQIGTMFIEMSSYVGDVLSYYLDSNLKESMLLYAEEYRNVLYLAQSFGYPVKGKSPANVTLDVYQQLPAIGKSGKDIDFRFALNISDNMVVQSDSTSNIFRTLEPVDFSNINTQNFEASVYQVDTNNNPIVYLVKKSVPAIAGKIDTIEATFAAPEQFSTFTIPYSDSINVIDVVDSEGDKWTEVDFLAQDTVFVDTPNDSYHNNESTDSEKSESPYILKVKRVAKRFITKRTQEGYLQLQFGSGISSYSDKILIPSKQTVSDFLSNYTFTDTTNNFLNTRTYGLAPANTTLTIRYSKGGGTGSNVPQNDLIKISSVPLLKTENDFTFINDKKIYSQMRATLAVTNPEPATGGREGETIDEIRQNALAFFTAQNRCVTESDFVIKSLSMPSKYGSITKAYARKSIDNFSIDLYVLGYNNKNNLTILGNSTKENLKSYLSSFKGLSTSINIKDAFIINIGVRFNIIVNPKYNKNEIILKGIQKLKEYFQIDKWQIGQPIYLVELYNLLNTVEGIRSVTEVKIFNRYSTFGYNEYSNNYYNIDAATIDDIVYPSMDPCIFECKYPNVDIEGTAR